MIKSALLSQMTNFSYFKWHTKDVNAGGCSVGYGYNPRTKGWWQRVCNIKSATSYKLDDRPVGSNKVPIDIRRTYLNKVAA